MRPARVTVIVPTKDRWASLRLLLDSLADQTFDGSVEVIVIDDGSTDRTPDVVAASGVRYLRTPGVGAVEARCVGVKAATGEILAFTDDDCVVDNDWIQSGVEEIERGADIVQGETVPQRPVTALERTVSHAADDGLFPTCNVFYDRTAFDRAGGFDRSAVERLGFRSGPRARGLGFGEDTLLGWAVARAGTAAASRRAIVRHEVVRASIPELVSRAWMAGAFPVLLREVPELRRTLVHKRFVLGRPDTRLSVYGLVLLVIGPLRPIGALVAAGWVAARALHVMRRGGSMPDRLIGVGVQLALDVTTSVALIVGSVRARTTVL
jgi:hypothetical protein